MGFRSGRPAAVERQVVPGLEARRELVRQQLSQQQRHELCALQVHVPLVTVPFHSFSFLVTTGLEVVGWKTSSEGECRGDE